MWPTQADYQQAVRRPNDSFEDSELRSAQVALDSFGRPRVFSNGGAAIFPMSSQSRQLAVRCFLNKAPDRTRRYSALRNHLQEANRAAPASCWLTFDYAEKGIAVQQNWFPIVKMQWVDGDPLCEFVRKNEGDHALMHLLAEKWLAVSRWCRQAGIAHGDLQPNNILIVNGEYKLIDYDCAFVPSLAGLRSVELGNENYQHPGRDYGHFGDYLDNFPDWIIYTSFIALGVDPRFFKFVDLADNCLLFRKQDFVNPQQSEVLRRLKEHSSEQLRFLALQIESLLRVSCDRVPKLSRYNDPVASGTQSQAQPSPVPVHKHLLDVPVTATKETKGTPARAHPDILDSPAAKAQPIPIRAHPHILDSGGAAPPTPPVHTAPAGSSTETNDEVRRSPSSSRRIPARIEPEPAEPPSRSSSKSIMIMAVCLVLLVGGAGAAVLLMPKPAATPSSTPVPTTTVAAKVSTSELVSEAQKLLDNGDFQNAVTKFGAAIEQEPKSAKAYGGRGQAFLGLKRYAEALDDYNKALAIEPDEKEYFKGRGKSYLGLEQYLKAVADYKKAKSLGAEDSSLSSDLGRCYGGLGQYQQAIEYFDESLETKPDANAYYLRGGLYYGLEKYEKALEDYKLAVALNPKDADAWYQMGGCYYCLKRYKDAQKPYRKAIELYNAKGNTAWANKAVAFLKEVSQP